MRILGKIRFAPAIAPIGLFFAVWTMNVQISRAQNPAPAIYSLSPTGVTAGAPAFTLTVNGNNFISASAVNWNGIALPTTYISASQLTVVVPASDISTIGTASVTVSNSTPGGRTSNGITFFIGSIVTGTVAGAPPGSAGVSIYDNGQEILTAGDGVITFNSKSPTYNVTVTPPAGETCTVANGGPQIGDPTNVWISCQPINAPPPASNWTPLVNPAPDTISGTMLLLSDGTVIANAVNDNRRWFRLTPDSNGHYVHGTWTTIPSSNCGHGDFASQVLTDGTVFVAGGEYGAPGRGIPGCAGTTEANSGVDTEIYDPVANAWTKFMVNANGQTVNPLDPPTSLIDPTQKPNFNALCGKQAFADMTSETLPDGSVLMAPVCPKNCGDTLIFNPKLFDPNSPSSAWSFGGTLANPGGTYYSCNEQETSWVKLQDGSILTADPPVQPGANETSERYIPSLHEWVQDKSLGFSLFDSEYGYSGDGEEGPAFLLPNGTAIFIGGGPFTGIYTPGPQPAPGSPPVQGAWTQGSLSPNGPATGGAPLSADDVPGAMMVDGNILLALNFAATPNDLIPSPFFFYEYNPVQNTFTEVPGPGNPGAPSPWADCGPPAMLDLPDGTVLMPSGCNNATQLYVYQPSGAPLPEGQPSIISITPNTDGSYHLTGTGLNGISEGGVISDDAQMASNYPLVRVTSANGVVTYARTYNWSSTGVAPGAPGSTDFKLPPTDARTCQLLQVVANGNASAPLSLTVPWCVLPPSIHPICDKPCGGEVVVWASQILQGLGDPWDRLSLTLLPLTTNEASRLAEDAQVLVTTQALSRPELERWIATEPAEQGGSQRRLLIVGPTVELRDHAMGKGLQHNTLGGTNALVGTVSIPYQSRGLSPRALIRIVKYDDRRGRWVRIGSQTTDKTKHLVTALISGVGKFTVVADIPPVPQ